MFGSVAGDDIAVLAGEDGVGEAEGADGAGDLGHLRVTVGAGIARRGQEPVDGPGLEVQRARSRRGAVPTLRRIGRVDHIVRLVLVGSGGLHDRSGAYGLQASGVSLGIG